MDMELTEELKKNITLSRCRSGWNRRYEQG